MPKKWDELKPDEQQKISAYLTSHLVGREIAEAAGGDMDYAVWLCEVEAICTRLTDCSYNDIGDYLWRDAFDAGAKPQDALNAALDKLKDELGRAGLS